MSDKPDLVLEVLNLIVNVNELKSRISVAKPDIVALTGTNPKFGKPCVEHNIHGYNTICNSSQPLIHGVCVFVKSSLHAYKDNVLCSVEYSESVWCQVPLSGNDCLILGVIYHSPNSNSLNFDQLCSLLTQAVNIGVSHPLVVGDLTCLT